METKTLRQWLDSHLEYGRALHQSPFTLRARRYHGRNFLDWLESHCHVHTPDRLRPEHLEAWTKHLAGLTTGRGLPHKAKTTNKLIESAKAFLRYLAERQLLPPALLTRLAYVKEPKLLPTSVLTHAQVKQMLQGIPTTDALGWRDRSLLELLYSTGIRARELVGLNVGDVDFGNATAVVFGKGQKQRVVPIGRTALRLLESYFKGVRPFLLKNSQEQALFLNRQGKRLPYESLLRMVHRHAEHIGVDMSVTPHTFRRSCATEMIRGGANLYHVKDLLGHETLDTLRHYAKLNVDDLRKTLARCHPRERADQAQP
ncbi:MAG: tyrosine-type recombinase/integrase [Verrucomicrobiota bacterium]|jgi:site-specific recombinase XerD